MMIDELVYKMAMQAGGSPLDIMERAQTIQDTFDKFGLKVESTEDIDE